MRFPPPLPLFVPPVDPALSTLLKRQIDHYFSDDNLAKNLFLRPRIDDEGWVDIAFIAAFPMVQRMTQSLQLILDSLKDSSVVEIQFCKISIPNLLTASIFSAQRGQSTMFSQNSQLLLSLFLASGLCSGMRSGCFRVENLILNSLMLRMH